MKDETLRYRIRLRRHELRLRHCVREAYDKNVLGIYKGKAKFLVSGLDGASAAVLGASAIGWEMNANGK